MEQSDVALWWLRLNMKLNYDTVMYASIGWPPKTSVKRDCSVLVKLHTRRIGIPNNLANRNPCESFSREFFEA